MGYKYRASPTLHRRRWCALSPLETSREESADATALNSELVHGAAVIGAGKLVAKWRTELNLSRRKLAHKLRHSDTQVHDWENNKQHISLLDLQQLSHMAGKNLEQALRTLPQPPESQNTAIKWKGAVYTVDQFKDSIRNPHATLDYSKTQQTYYLKLSPIANVEFHKRDKITILLKKDGVQAITEIVAVKGTRANIMKAVVELMDIKPGDKLDLKALNVRGPNDPPWTHGIQATPATTSGETRIPLPEKLEELGLKVTDGDYAKIAAQTEGGQVLTTGRIENRTIKIGEDATRKLPTKGGEGTQTLTLRTDSIVLSPKPFAQKTRPPPKPRNKNTFKLDGKEITIEHQDQEYKITTIEAEKIGNLHLYRYKTKQGEEILHIPTEDKTIPPYETPWYALPPTTMIYLDKAYKHRLLETAIDKAGGKTQLRQELKKRGTCIAIKYVNDQLIEKEDGMRSDKLISILRYVNRDLDGPSNNITAIGNARAIKNPKLPFNLNTPHGARIVAARYSDGSIHTPQDAGPRFEYTNKDEEQRNRIAESLRQVFGTANITDRTFDDGRIPRLRATTDIVGHVLERAGAVTGRIITQNPDIPEFIRNGSREMKREWLEQSFGDEGSPSTHTGITALTRAVDATHRLSGDQRNRLDVTSREWKEKVPKVVVRKKHVKYCMFKDLPQDIQDKLKPERSRLLDSEAKILHDDFKIDFDRHPVEIYRREDGYSVTLALQISSKEDNRRFCNEIGFPQNRKQERLKTILGDQEEENH